MMGGRKQQFQQGHSNRSGLSIDGGYNENYNYYEPSQPYGWQSSNEDFRQRQATPCRFPTNLETLGGYYRSHAQSYNDDGELLERQLNRGYRMNPSVNDSGWQSDSTDNLHHLGRGVLTYGGQRNYMPRAGRELNKDEELERRLLGYRMSANVNDFGWRGSSGRFRQVERGSGIAHVGQRDDTLRTDWEMRQHQIDSENDYSWQIRSSSNVRPPVGRGMSRSPTGGYAHGGLRDHTPKKERELRQYKRDGCEDDFYQGRISSPTLDFTRERPTSSIARYHHRCIPAYRNDPRQGRNPRERGGYDRGIESRDDNCDDGYGYDDDHSLVERKDGTNDCDRFKNVVKLMNRWRLWEDNY